MYKLASCCLLFIGFLTPLLSLPLMDSRELALQLSAPDEDARLGLEELERTSLLQTLREMLGAERGIILGRADPSANIFNPRRNVRKFQALSGQDPSILLSHLLTGTRKQYKKRGTPSECFWKYCV
ncbi:urotensin-2 [Carlito syrichta]|uniref:Urotensin-2 n=1 Tax=Carlito syrichta TaxID=1868482 RepID=A0A1U7TRJ3_CARSF|nr:urotensin-2 [Carlito syrichta]